MSTDIEQILRNIDLIYNRDSSISAVKKLLEPTTVPPPTGTAVPPPPPGGPPPSPSPKLKKQPGRKDVRFPEEADKTDVELFFTPARCVIPNACNCSNAFIEKVKHNKKLVPDGDLHEKKCATLKQLCDRDENYKLCTRLTEEEDDNDDDDDDDDNDDWQGGRRKYIKLHFK